MTEPENHPPVPPDTRNFLSRLAAWLVGPGRRPEPPRPAPTRAELAARAGDLIRRFQQCAAADVPALQAEAAALGWAARFEFLILFWRGAPTTLCVRLVGCITRLADTLTDPAQAVELHVHLVMTALAHPAAEVMEAAGAAAVAVLNCPALCPPPGGTGHGR